jgi:hypothetical protein
MRCRLTSRAVACLIQKRTALAISNSRRTHWQAQPGNEGDQAELTAGVFFRQKKPYASSDLEEIGGYLKRTLGNLAAGNLWHARPKTCRRPKK